MATKRRQIHALVNQKIFKESEESTVQREKDSVTSKYFLNENIRLSSDFYEKPCIDLAKSFLGQILVRKLPDGLELRGKIVETESYLGGEDEASHSRGGKRTERNVAMYMKPGTIYVYQIYGVYFCMNISSKGDGAAVLLRSLEPIEGLDEMRNLRSVRRNASKSLKNKELCNGPSKLCQALDINKSFDRGDLASDPNAWLEAGSDVREEDIVSCARIGIGYAGEWKHKSLRFYIKGNQYVSVRDKAAESVMTSVHTSLLVDNK
ncbi:PREDICTED: DNA-3-methyladenine glycosylase [Nanorana parkeri]|uniref:DNA-3-methyladenine glycosylase n=1 Tax=Nanorana parkeri TaxID=125878 RepID=UPI000854FDEF|nr:PREDICTED: DNA-3-methyladenine glycosylase [Nanorana parkeri]